MSTLPCASLLGTGRVLSPRRFFRTDGRLRISNFRTGGRRAAPEVQKLINTKQWRLPKISCFMPEEKGANPYKDSSNFDGTEQERHLESLNAKKPNEKEDNWFSVLQEITKGIFMLHGDHWIVPWTKQTIAQVMLLWVTSFWLVGSWIIPFLAHAAGFQKESLTHRGQALYSLLTDIVEGLTGIAIINQCLSRFRPLPPDWFKIKLRGSWYFDVVLGCLMFPLVNILSHINVLLVPAVPTMPVGVSSVEQSIVARDPVAMILYAVVVSVCAPVWEEILFRGFLLPSLTRYMPIWLSIVVTAMAFALAHFNAQRLLPLVFLGIVMGVVFTKSRNLLSSILLHSLWNVFVFLDLMK